MQSALKSLRPNILRKSEQVRGRKRPKVSESTIQRRKDIKKLRHVNIYSVDHTGERLYHPWLEPQRLRSLMLSYQDIQNKHRHTLEIDAKDKKDMIEKNTEFSQYSYWVHMNQHHKLEKHAKVHDKLIDDIETLPFNLRNEVKEQFKKSKNHPERPEILKNYNLYYEQIMRLYPDDYTDGIKLGKRLQYILDEKLGEND